MLYFDIITIFPNMFDLILNESMLKRAQEKNKVCFKVWDLRDFTEDKHLKVDDRPFGGGPGMVMTPQPIFKAIKEIKGRKKAKVILLCPSGCTLTQKMAHNFSQERRLILLCGHYEGIDERVRDYLVDEVVSIGDYILTGGELPAMVFMDCVTRLIPGVLGREESLQEESFEKGLLEYPQYTRPGSFKGMDVPDVLLSGDHKRIDKWRKEMSLKKTKKYRPDLLK